MSKTKKSFWKFNIPLSLSVLIILMVIIGIWGWFSSNLIIYAPFARTSDSPDKFGAICEEITLLTESGYELSCWFIPSEIKSDKTVIVCHGWGADKSDILPATLFLSRKGNYNLFYFDFQNHGESSKGKTSLGYYESENIKEAVRFIKTEKQEFAKKLGIYGFSMGASAAVIAGAENKDIDAFVLESPFLSFNDTVSRFAKLFYKLPKFPLVDITLIFTKIRLGFNPEKYSAEHFIEDISPMPVFFIYAENDRRVPLSEGEKLYNIAKSPKDIWIMKEVRHGDGYSKYAYEYEMRVLGFFRKSL